MVAAVLFVGFPAVFSLDVDPSWGVSSSGPNSSEFQESRAKLFMYMSAAAYCDAGAVNQWNCKACQLADSLVNATAFSDSKTDTHGFVGHSVGESTQNIVVSFRGSVSLSNWITNLNFPKTSAYPQCTNCRVHEGFYKAWMSVKDVVVAEVQRLLKIYPKAQIFVTGHSLGGALAALCAAQLGASTASLKDPIEGVYTYGQPRVGNINFRDFYNSGTHVSWRLTHYRDPVPHLPLHSQGFTHTSTEVFYNQPSTMHKMCDGSGEDKLCSNQFLIDYSVADHLSYLAQPISDLC
jgi:hypothetical protein